MAEQRRGSDGACEGDQIRHDVVDRSDKTPIDDVGAGHHEPTSERNGEEELDHGRKSLLRRKPNGQRQSRREMLGQPSRSCSAALAMPVGDR